MNPPNPVEHRVSDGGMGRTAARASASVAAATRSTSTESGISLAELAERFGCTVKGDSTVRLTHVSTLEDADSEAITFIANPKYLPLLASTQAGAVILSPQHAEEAPTPGAHRAQPLRDLCAHRFGAASVASSEAGCTSDCCDRRGVPTRSRSLRTGRVA